MNETVTATPTPTAAPIGGMRRATVLLIERLKQGKPGDSLTDAELTALCGKDTRAVCQDGTRKAGDGYGYLQTAMRHCLREYGILWRRVVGEGRVECIPNEAKVEVANAVRRHMHRQSKYAMRVLGSVDTAALNHDQRREHLIATAIQGTLLQASAPTTVKRLAQNNNPQPLDMHKLLAAMRTTE